MATVGPPPHPMVIEVKWKEGLDKTTFKMFCHHSMTKLKEKQTHSHTFREKYINQQAYISLLI